MRTSENGVAFIKEWEGLELQAYQDIAGVWTIGYGHTGSGVAPGRKISECEAVRLLAEDLRAREARVASLVAVALAQHEFDALVSFEFNTGGLSRSTALVRLNQGDREGAAEALTWWNKSSVSGALREVRGLTRRRRAEAALFLFGDADAQHRWDEAS